MRCAGHLSHVRANGSAQSARALGGDGLENVRIDVEIGVGDGPVDDDLGETELLMAPGEVDERLDRRERRVAVRSETGEQDLAQLVHIPPDRRARLAQPVDLPGQRSPRLLRRAPSNSFGSPVVTHACP